MKPINPRDTQGEGRLDRRRRNKRLLSIPDVTLWLEVTRYLKSQTYNQQ